MNRYHPKTRHVVGLMCEDRQQPLKVRPSSPVIEHAQGVRDPRAARWQNRQQTLGHGPPSWLASVSRLFPFVPPLSTTPQPRHYADMSGVSLTSRIQKLTAEIRRSDPAHDLRATRPVPGQVHGRRIGVSALAWAARHRQDREREAGAGRLARGGVRRCGREPRPVR